MLVHPYVSHFILHKFAVSLTTAMGCSGIRALLITPVVWSKCFDVFVGNFKVLTPPRMKKRGELVRIEIVRKSGMCQKTKIS